MNGARLREARQAAKLTLRELAEKSHVDQRTISDIEQGRNRNPSYEKVVRLARALALDPDELWPIPYDDDQADLPFSPRAVAQ